MEEKTVTVGAYIPADLLDRFEQLRRSWQGFRPTRSQLIRLAMEELIARNKGPDEPQSTAA